MVCNVSKLTVPFSNSDSFKSLSFFDYFLKKRLTLSKTFDRLFLLFTILTKKWGIHFLLIQGIPVQILEKEIVLESSVRSSKPVLWSFVHQLLDKTNRADIV